MTQNIRMDADSPSDSPDNWGRREPVLTRLIHHVRPDILCTQELLFHQRDAVRRGLGRDYEMIGYGREGGSKGEHSAIFINSCRYRVDAWDQFWLSDTPDVIASSTWGNVCTRIAVWARLRDVETADTFIVANTHTDNVSELARISSMKLIGERLKAASKGLPIVLCGDFNEAAGRSAEFEAMAGPFGFKDAWSIAQRHDSPEYGSFVDYRAPVEGGDRIDWILVSSDVLVHSMSVYPFQVNGAWASDHIPAIVSVTMGN
ncbi:MAG: endonuclease/exonuclease/phosphatase family protein [Bifidobacterium sp.]|uniref:Endonuclease/exonuclease/phosphatase family protein n=1 Tax=Bifidobacterium fermentum TaxID=3059035 RepID=A0AB39UI71_9BIFI